MISIIEPVRQPPHLETWIGEKLGDKKNLKNSDNTLKQL